MNSDTTYSFSKWELSTIKHALEVYEHELSESKELMPQETHHALDSVIFDVSNLLGRVITALTSKEEYAEQKLKEKQEILEENLFKAMNENA